MSTKYKTSAFGSQNIGNNKPKTNNFEEDIEDSENIKEIDEGLNREFFDSKNLETKSQYLKASDNMYINYVTFL